MNELETLIMGVQRKLLVMYDDLDLSDLSSYNQVFILLVEESKGSVGGRGGGSGHRKIAQVHLRLIIEQLKKYMILRMRI